MPPAADDGHLDAVLTRAADGLRRANRVVVMTGAGVSAESGLATFRGGGGLWEGHAVEDVLSHRQSGAVRPVIIDDHTIAVFLQSSAHARHQSR